MRQLPLLFFLLIGLPAQAGILRIPEDFTTLKEAVRSARNGDSLYISDGEYTGGILLDKPISLIGTHPESCLISGHGDSSENIVLTVSDSAYVSGVTVRDGATGVFLKAGAALSIHKCVISDNSEDGIGFENNMDTRLFMSECIVRENTDGIDLESTQGHILNSRFEENKDDGLDFDGDSGVLVYGCSFVNNADDGIEIRIATRTHAFILDSAFEENGEDGIEIINSPIDGGIYNIICVQNCDFRDNVRYGFGCVAHGVEEYTGDFIKAAVYAAGNTFAGFGKGDVCPNYDSLFRKSATFPRETEARIECEGGSAVRTVPVRIPLLVGIYNLRPTPDGTMASDLEGVVVSDGKVFAADDNNRAIYVLNRYNGEVIRSISTNPFPDSSYSAPGPEGLDIVARPGENSLLLADDDGTSLYFINLNEGAFGGIEKRIDTSSVGKLEGIEMLDTAIVGVAGTKIYPFVTGKPDDIAEPLTVVCEGFGTHIAGVGAGPGDTELYFTLSGYVKSNANRRNFMGAFFAMNRSFNKIRCLWHLGPFSNDPRGIALADGLVYVADGKSDFSDEEKGEMNRGGIKVFVFLRENDPAEVVRSMSLLPVRRSGGF